MSDKNFLNALLGQLKQNQFLLLLIPLIVLGIFLLFFVFTLFKNSSDNEVSLAQALTLVAEASQTAQGTYLDPVATEIVIGTSSSVSSVVRSTPIISTRSVQIVATTRASTVPSSTKSTTLGQNISQSSPTFPVDNAVVRPTYTPKPTETIKPQDTPTATLTSTPTPGPGLPGLSMSTVISELKSQKGFVCTQQGSSPGPILWMCDVQIGNDVWYHVDLYGSSGVEVTNLLVSVFQTYPDDAKAIDIISFLASLPYNNSNPSEASQWVSQTLPGIQSVNDVKEKTIGNVRFRLYGGTQGRYLEMGEPVQQ